MSAPDILRFADILGRRLDSPEIVDFMRTWNAQATIDRSDDWPVGMLSVHKEDFDAILAFGEEWGGPRGAGESDAWVSVLRFFSPEYCQGKKILPYRAPIIDDVALPLPRSDVQKRFGTPARSRRDARHIDEYDYDECFVRFVYPGEKEYVAFVEFGRRSLLGP
jgi:hypothetical protein